MIVGASFDTVDENKAFVDKFSYPFPLLCDTDRTMGMAYGAASEPTTKHARRISYVIGPDGIISQAHAEVDVAKHAADILQKI